MFLSPTGTKTETETCAKEVEDTKQKIYVSVYRPFNKVLSASNIIRGKGQLMAFQS